MMFRRKMPLPDEMDLIHRRLVAKVQVLEARLIAVERAAHHHCPRCRRSTESGALFTCPPSSTCKPLPGEAA